MTQHPRAGQPALASDLVDVPALLRAYAEIRPDPSDPAQRVAFGTSGHRGSAFRGAFNENHILATTEAICRYRASKGYTGPLFIGRDTHALSEPAGDATRHRLELPVGENDELRLGLLRERGYEETPSCGATYRLLLGRRASPRRRLYGGYVLRNTQPTDPLDCRQIAGLLNAAFSRTFHTPEEYATFARLAPSFRADLDLVAVAPDGTFAAYVGASYDEAGRRGILEPVCTAPGHRRRGLARALIEEGLCRLEARGAVDAVVETGSGAAANALYAGLGFTESYRATTWRRVW